MLTSDEIIRLFADMYYQAALENVAMRRAAEALETIRDAMSEGKNLFEVWNRIDDRIGLVDDERLQQVFIGFRERIVDEPLQQVLIEFRKRFEQQIFQSEVARLHEIFIRKTQSQDGWSGRKSMLRP